MNRRLSSLALLLALAAAWGACVPVYITVIFVFALIPLWRCTGLDLAGRRLVCGALYGLTSLPLAVLALADSDLLRKALMLKSVSPRAKSSPSWIVCISGRLFVSGRQSCVDWRNKRRINC